MKTQLVLRLANKELASQFVAICSLRFVTQQSANFVIRSQSFALAKLRRGKNQTATKKKFSQF